MRTSGATDYADEDSEYVIIDDDNGGQFEDIPDPPDIADLTDEIFPEDNAISKIALKKTVNLYESISLKNLLNFLGRSKNPGAIGRVFSAIGVVASTT
ncbi:MAG: hypothetical protein ACHP6I_01670, partial [Rickettsiales bacterium]